jgi:anti-anti-sigma factor
MAVTESSSVSMFHRGRLAIAGSDADGNVVRLRGEHDASTVAVLSKVLAQPIALDDADLVVDFSGFRFMSAATADVIVRAREFLELRSRSLVVRSPSRCAQRVLDLSGVSGPVDARRTEALPRTATVGALGTWVAVPATERVGGRAHTFAPKSAVASAPVPLSGVTVETKPSRADVDLPGERLATNVARRRGP